MSYVTPRKPNICQFTSQPCQYINCPLWDEGLQRCLFQLAIFKILGRPETAPQDTVFLNPRQRFILERIAQGRHNKDIAHDLDISPKTLARHIADLLLALGAKNRAHAVTIAVQSRIISLDKVYAKQQISG